tara:strand:- start:721 stop:1149 length:429 start_codon:yes stop_codon:yes gene_type:complete
MNLKVIPMDADSWGWFNSKLPVLSVEDTSGLIAIDTKTGDYVGGCVLDTWTTTSVQGHFLMESPMVFRNKFFHLCATYVFEEMNRKIIYALIPGDNKKSLKFFSHLGFTEEARLKDAFNDGIDCVILELKKENCMYLLKEVA